MVRKKYGVCALNVRVYGIKLVADCFTCLLKELKILGQLFYKKIRLD